MTKYKRKKLKIYHRIRTTYEAKRRTPAWKESKRMNKKGSKHKILQQKKKFFDLVAPQNFSLLNNTDEMLLYFSKARRMLKDGFNVNFNINDIEELTSDGISMLIAAINDSHFYGKSICSGNAPRNPILKNMFIKSWFYRYVNSKYKNESSDNDFIYRHQHVNWRVRVQWESAKYACIKWTKHTFWHEWPCPFLFNIIAECMWNTNNHANVWKWEKCSWWLLAHPQEDSKNTCYTFLDMWVWIFDSLVVRWFKNKWKLLDNSLLVWDLLSWIIWSRLDKDNKVRGKWIPRMVRYSKLDTLNKFYIITNNMKINLQTGIWQKLKSNFKWTLLHWEIQPKIIT